LQGIIVRDELTNEWHERAAKEGQEFATLTDTLQHCAFDLTAAEHKMVKHNGAAAEPARLDDHARVRTDDPRRGNRQELHQAHDSQGFDELHQDAHEAGEVGGAARRDVEARTQRPVVSSENYNAPARSAS
jgi:DNA-damage-inducible protein D